MRGTRITSVFMSAAITAMLLGVAPFAIGAKIRRLKAPEPGPSMKAGFGRLEVTSEPPGATVFLNNTVAGTTPYVASRLRTGAYGLKVVLEWYQPWERRIVINDGQVLKEVVKLQPDFALVTIWCNAVGKVSIDGESARSTPLRDYRLRPGPHRLRVTAPYYQPEVREIVASPGQRLELRVDLGRQRGHLAIHSQPSNAVVYLNGQRHKQQTPALFRELPAGPHVVRLTHGPLEAIGHVVVEADTTAELRLRLERSQPRVEVRPGALDPDLSEAHMRIGDEYLKRGLFREAADEYSRAVFHDPHNPVLHNNLGVAQFSLDRWKEAKNSLLLAVLLDKNYPDAWYNLGCVYAHEHAYSKAVEVLKAAVTLDEDLRIDLFVDDDLTELRETKEFRLLLE